jgi:hypothetical protein
MIKFRLAEFGSQRAEKSAALSSSVFQAAAAYCDLFCLQLINSSFSFE